MINAIQQKINIEHVVMLTAQSNYTTVHLADGNSFLYAITLGKLEKRFGDDAFIRPNRSTLVNTKYVLGVHNANIKHKSSYIKMKNGIVIYISRRRSRLLKMAYRSMISCELL
jgi:DNA-binding LytR/AlgR family response regulator